GTSVTVSTGRTSPTTVRQTVTLLFNKPLPAGAYQIELDPSIQATASSLEKGLLVGSTFAGHPVVSVKGGQIVNGSKFVATNLVGASGAPSGLDTIVKG